MFTVSLGRRHADDSPTASLAATVAAHIEQCKTDKAEIKKALEAQNLARTNMHTENQSRFSRLERVYYLVTAIGLVGGFFLTDAGHRILMFLF
jgi:hypothetical protein